MVFRLSTIDFHVPVEKGAGKGVRVAGVALETTSVRGEVSYRFARKRGGSGSLSGQCFSVHNARSNGNTFSQPVKIEKSKVRL